MREQMTNSNGITTLQSPWRDFKTFTSETKQQKAKEFKKEGKILEYLY
jgi:hypothetical protein